MIGFLLLTISVSVGLVLIMLFILGIIGAAINSFFKGLLH